MVGPASAKGSRDSLRGATDESAHHWNFSFLNQRLRQIPRGVGDRINLRLRGHEAVVGHEHVARVDVLGWNPAQLEKRRDQMRRQLLAKGGDSVEAARCRVA